MFLPLEEGPERQPQEAALRGLCQQQQGVPEDLQGEFFVCVDVVMVVLISWCTLFMFYDDIFLCVLLYIVS